FDAAEASYRQAIALNPNLAAAYLGYGWLLMEQERVAEQMEMWQRAGRLDPLSPVHRTHGAFTVFRSGRLEEAEAELRMILEQHPDFPPAHVILGEVLAGRGDQAGAIGHFRRALEMNPSLPLPHVGLIEALLDLELDAAAEAALERAWSVPDLTEVGLGMEFLLHSESSPPSDETVARLWNQLPALAEARPLRAAHAATVLHLREGAHARAMDVIEAAEPRLAGDLEALSLDGLQRALYCPYAFALIQSGDTDRGRAVARWVLDRIRTGPDYARRRHLDPIVCHTVLGETDRALAVLREAAESGVPSGWRFLAFRPELEALRADPEYAGLVAKIRSEAERQRARL
ncbi:MAG: tetratricopeptide repeat protein, partial [Wenzhouxiangella sp.]